MHRGHLKTILYGSTGLLTLLFSAQLRSYDPVPTNNPDESPQISSPPTHESEPRPYSLASGASLSEGNLADIPMDRLKKHDPAHSGSCSIHLSSSEEKEVPEKITINLPPPNTQETSSVTSCMARLFGYMKTHPLTCLTMVLGFPGSFLTGWSLGHFKGTPDMCASYPQSLKNFQESPVIWNQNRTKPFFRYTSTTEDTLMPLPPAIANATLWKPTSVFTPSPLQNPDSLDAPHSQGLERFRRSFDENTINLEAHEKILKKAQKGLPVSYKKIKRLPLEVLESLLVEQNLVFKTGTGTITIYTLEDWKAFVEFRNVQQNQRTVDFSTNSTLTDDFIASFTRHGTIAFGIHFQEVEIKLNEGSVILRSDRDWRILSALLVWQQTQETNEKACKPKPLISERAPLRIDFLQGLFNNFSPLRFKKGKDKIIEYQTLEARQRDYHENQKSTLHKEKLKRQRIAKKRFYIS